MTVYADYTYYTDIYLGNELAAEIFDRYARQATQYINYETMNRAAGYWADPETDNEPLSDCTCELAEMLYFSDNADALQNPGGEASKALEIVGQYHVTYSSFNTSSAEGQQAVNAKIAAIIARHLQYTNMLCKVAAPARCWV